MATISKACPGCGSKEHRKVTPEGASLRFALDRVCLRCGTEYTPPTPLWARCVFGVLGIGMLALAVAAVVMYFARPDFSSRDKLPMLAFGLVPVGLGCLFLALSGRPSQASGEDAVGYANNTLSS